MLELAFTLGMIVGVLVGWFVFNFASDIERMLNG